MMCVSFLTVVNFLNRFFVYIKCENLQFGQGKLVSIQFLAPIRLAFILQHLLATPYYLKENLSYQSERG
jgi:hypothetical protein